ncbi:hypothetical protein DPMN_182194 [Dreissena polymorpha]|uniref:Uncharacterized protein n=1 Tax=Dreissena polymorpha TaxID=45954 RepID=A0A9D4DEA7_DREPO|nr:hypothetical protein DPMN_182194 [Dreissena polymorpha]
MTSLATNFDTRKTRNKLGSDVILEYETLTKSYLEGSSYFHNVLKNGDFKNDKHHIGNFVLNLILPLPVVGSLTGASRNRFSKRVFLNLFDDSLFRIEEVTAGSLSEGLGLPEIVTVHGQSFRIETPDEDKKFIFHGFPVSERASTAFAHMEQSRLSPPSFVKLKLNKDFKWQRQLFQHWNTKEFLTQNGFIDRAKFTAQLKSLLQDRIFEHSIKCKDGIVPVLPQPSTLKTTSIICFLQITLSVCRVQHGRHKRGAGNIEHEFGQARDW